MDLLFCQGIAWKKTYRRCGVDTEIPYRLLFLPVCVAPGVHTEFPYRVCIVDMGGWLPRPCLPTPFLIPRSKRHSRSNSWNSGAFSEQLSEWLSRPLLCENPILGATLGATLGIGWTLKTQILGAFFSKLVWSPRARVIETAPWAPETH